jgi:hypothetical protein
MYAFSDLEDSGPGADQPLKVTEWQTYITRRIERDEVNNMMVDETHPLPMKYFGLCIGLY